MMWFVFVFILLASGKVLGSFTRFTKIECEVLDPTYFVYRQCDLKLLEHGRAAINVHVNLLKGPVRNGKVNLSLWRKYNEYRPFMFNSTVDFCKLMTLKNMKISFDRMFFDALRQASNINHTCPYEDAIIVRDMVFKEEFLKYYPLPTGEYKIRFMAATNNEWKSIVSVYFIRKEGLVLP